MKLDAIITNALNKKASDIHLSCNSSPILRIDGEISNIRIDPISKEALETMISTIINEEQLEKFHTQKELDFAFTHQESGTRFRANLFEDLVGPALVMRIISDKIQTLDELHTPNVFKKIASLSKGLVLVTGPTGSGKSTTMAALIDYINDNYQKHILLIEDPVEFIHQSKKSKITQREIGTNSLSFKNALKSAMREDPDVILIGEMRDHETIQLALTAAETGHLVISTLHTNSAPKTIDRIVDVFSANEKDMIRSMLSNSLEAIISQQLIARADGKGRVAAFEILVANSAVRNLIRENKNAQLTSVIQTGAAVGMCTMKDSIKKLESEKLISNNNSNSASSQSTDVPINDGDF